MTFVEWLRSVSKEQRPLVLGIDPHPGILEAWGESDTPAGLDAWCGRVTDQALSAGIQCVKVQVAFFERQGVRGFQSLHTILGTLREQGVWVVGDAKRGDIGSTMKGYATAWLSSGSDFEVDALTVSPYLGFHSLDPVLELSVQENKGVFVLSATSNPEAWSSQGARLPDGRSTAALILEEAQTWSSEHAYGGVGVVIGATVDFEALGLQDHSAHDIPVLAPGYGTQGADLRDVGHHFASFHRVLPVVARSVLSAGPDGFAGAWALAFERLASA